MIPKKKIRLVVSSKNWPLFKFLFPNHPSCELLKTSVVLTTCQNAQLSVNNSRTAS